MLLVTLLVHRCGCTANVIKCISSYTNPRDPCPPTALIETQLIPLQASNVKSSKNIKCKVADLRARCQQLQSWMLRAERAIDLHHQFDPFFLGAAALGREKFNAVVECFDVVSMTPCYISGLARFVADEGNGDAAAEGMRAWALALANMVQTL